VVIVLNTIKEGLLVSMLSTLSNPDSGSISILYVVDVVDVLTNHIQPYRSE